MYLLRILNKPDIERISDTEEMHHLLVTTAYKDTIKTWIDGLNVTPSTTTINYPLNIFNKATQIMTSMDNCFSAASMHIALWNKVLADKEIKEL